MNTTNTINTDTLIHFLLQQQKVEKSIELDTAYKIFMDHLSINNRQGTIEAYQCCLKPVYNFFNKKYCSNGYGYSYMWDGVRYDEAYYFPQAMLHVLANISVRF